MKRLLAFGTIALASHAIANSRLINGKPVEPGTFREVIKIVSNGAGCTATVVGPNVIITAAHCASTGNTATFTIDGKTYTAKMTRSSLYPDKDHDLNVGITDQEITGVDPASVGGKASTGISITLLGFGCTDPGGHTASDGILRYGDTVVTGFSNFDMVSRKAGGAALCFGDSGGPAFVSPGKDGKHLLIGVNSKGNIQDTNYNTRTDIDESQSFLKGFAQTNNVQICGINKDCGGTPPPPTAPTCQLAVNPPQVKVGESVTISLTSQGEVTTASIDGKSVSHPAGSIVVTTTAIGNVATHGSVTGPGGTGTCDASYVVVDGPPPPPTAPTCSLVAIPDQVKIGEQVSLELTTQGKVTSAAIDGTSVTFPVGKKLITATVKGSFSVTGTATGPGGNGSCVATYTVDDGPQPPPSTPNFAVVPAYCGMNTLLETKVTQVCLAVLKKDASLGSVILNQVLLVTYSDSSQEVMPIVARNTHAHDAGEITTKEDLTMYANNYIKAKDYWVLDTRAAVLTKTTSARRIQGKSVDVPTAIEGRTMTGKYFLVDKLSPHSVSP